MAARIHLLTAAEVAEALGVPASTVHRLARTGELPEVRLGRRVHRYKPEDVEALVERATRQDAQALKTSSAPVGSRGAAKLAGDGGEDVQA